jgi:hypothetical protein
LEVLKDKLEAAIEACGVAAARALDPPLLHSAVGTGWTETLAIH